MIVATLENIHNQARHNPDLTKGIEFLKTLEPSKWEEGRFSIDGERVFAYVTSYTTKAVGDQVELEGHRKYIDLQFLVDGEETIGWTMTEGAAVNTPYSPDTDAWTGNAAADQLNWVKLRPGWLAILFPEDAHAPQCAAGQPMEVKKVVVKVLVP